MEAWPDEASLDLLYSEAMSALEAQLPFNCEHVVPQSWFEKKEPMRGDLHHLFACESGCNSFRGNIPYFDFPDFEEAIRDACGKRDPDQSTGRNAHWHAITDAITDLTTGLISLDEGLHAGDGA